MGVGGRIEVCIKAFYSMGISGIKLNHSLIDPHAKF